MENFDEKLTTNTYYDWLYYTFCRSRPRRFSAGAGLCYFSYNFAPGSANFFDPGAKASSNPRYYWGENGSPCGIPDPMKGIESTSAFGIRVPAKPLALPDEGDFSK